MKRTTVAAVFLAVLAVHSSELLGQAKDVQGWNKARWGMMAEEVQKAFGKRVVRLKHRSIYRSRGDTTYALFEVQNISIGSFKYNARFLMGIHSHKLKAVIIETPKQNAIDGQIMFRELQQMLTEKYGKPSYDIDERKPAGGFGATIVMQTMWTFPTTAIDLEYFENTGIGSGALTLEYRERDKKQLDKL